MKFTAIFSALALLSINSAAAPSDTLKTVSVEKIVVTAERSLRDIGVQKTALDSTVLTAGITSSLADVLSQNSAIFVKSSGRATLATASLRGTAPSHTVVSWNGIRLASPMLGMVDLSMIPSYLADNGEVYHGATSVSVTGGGLGGAVVLSTRADTLKGVGIKYIQNIASYDSFDEFLRFNYASGRWAFSTRALVSSSDNDFPYINYDKVGHPAERNKSCDYLDNHLLQEAYYKSPHAGNFALRIWGADSHRGIPKLSVDYRDDDLTRAWQDEKSLRGAAEWNYSVGNWRLNAKGGYNYDDLHYVYQFSTGGGTVARGVDSQSYSEGVFAEAGAECSIGNSLMLAFGAEAERHDVESRDTAPLIQTGYEARRNQLSGTTSARWKPHDDFGAALSLREEWRDGGFSPVIPALFLEWTVNPAGVLLSASAARNYRYPSLNDLYYVPGGNPNLKPERGYTFDFGVSKEVKKGTLTAGGKVAAFYSRIEDWILWRPTVKGFWTPVNLAEVESRGLESRFFIRLAWGDGWSLDANALFGITRSVNIDKEDASYGRQLPYVPLYSASATATIGYRQWQATYKWNYYSKRYTSYSGTSFSTGSVPEYFMNDISVSRRIEWRALKFKVRFDINNLFDEEYQSVLSRPMPPRNYAIGMEVEFGSQSRSRRSYSSH